MTKAIFIAGTGTDVGKTYISALIVKKLREAGINAGYYKAALSGACEENGDLIPGDAERVCRLGGIEGNPSAFVSYIYRAAVSPHLASHLEDRSVELSVVKKDFAAACAKYDYLLMEGSGGIACPLRWDSKVKQLSSDLVKALGLSSIIVGDSGLGAINSFYLTTEYMRREKLPCSGIILNRWQSGSLLYEDNRKMLEELTELPVLAVTAEGATELDTALASLTAAFREVKE